LTRGYRTLARSAVLAALAGAVLVFLSTVLFFLVPRIVHNLNPVEEVSDVFFGRVFQVRTWVLQWGLFFSTLLFAPAIRAASPFPLARRSFSVAALFVSSLFFVWFLFHFGNRQFGGWDFSILIDTGWRQILGQHPYTDFITPNPPGFNLGIYYAFRLFGVTWNAQIFATILFCLTTFFWIYWLLRRIAASLLVAFFLAFTIEGVTCLPLCFWWYNDVTSVLASVFLLSAIVYAQLDTQRGESGRQHAVWWSYLLSLALLGLMKPNIAGLLILSSTVLLFFAVRSKRRMLVATAAGVALCLTILLLHHIRLSDMIASYRAVAIERGGLSRFGLGGYTRLQKLLLLLWTTLFAAPLAALLPRLLAAWRQGRRRDFAFLLLFLPAFPITVYGMLTNGEIKDSETSLLVLSCGVLCLVLHQTGSRLRSLFVAMTISMLGGAIYLGAARERVYSIGPGQFFEYTNASRPIRDKFFSSLIATAYFDDVQRAVRQATASFPSPVFLGPRLEFDYADLRIPSPTGWPIYYQPGTSFARRDVPRVTEIWKAHHFQTLIFLGDDRTFYPADLLQYIDDNYERQPGFGNLQVYTHRH
jgi:hypothetical protein